MAVQTLVQIRRGTASEWSSVNPTLSAGEWGYETNTGRYKIGDGLTAWNSLRYSSLLPKSGEIVGSSGVGVTFSATTGVPVTISVTGIQSSQVNDFNTAVNSLITSAAISADQIMDIVNSGTLEGNNIDLTYNSGTHKLTIAVTGLTIGTDVQAYDSGLQSISSLTTTSGNYLYTTGSDTYTTGVITAFGRSLVDDTDAATARSTLGLGTIATFNSGDYSLAGHTHTSSNITDFNSSVSGLLPSFSGVSGVAISSLNNNTYTISLSDPTIQSTDITDFNTAVSGLIEIKALAQGSGIGIVNNSGTHTISVTGIPSSLITDLSSLATTEVVGRTGVQLSYDTINDKIYIDATGVSFSGHTHLWSNITDASTKATLSELTYLSGVTAGTASASRAVVLDASQNITGIGSITTTGNITVGGNLVVNGTTTTVNSTTVDIGDNIVRVNTSGLTTGGFEVYTGTDYKQLIWNVTTNRWEFSGGNVYTSGNFVGNLSGNASTVTNGVYTTDTGTVTSTMIADNTIVNADINSSAAIAYSKLNLSSSIVNADISESAAIADTKLATISTAGKVSNSATTATNANTASAIVARDASGNFSAGVITANLSGNASTVTNGVYTTDTGTVTNTMLAGSIAYSKLILTDSIVNADISSSAAIAYSKLNLASGIVDSDISGSAAISVNKLAASGVTLGSTTVNLGQTVSSINGLTSISGTSANSPTTLYYCVIDGGSP